MICHLTDSQTPWLLEVLYTIKRDLLRKIACKNKRPKSIDKKDISPFRTDRQPERPTTDQPTQQPSDLLTDRLT